MTMSEMESNQNTNDGHQSDDHGHANYSDGFESEGSSNHDPPHGQSSGKHSKTPNSRQSWRHNLMHMSSNFRTNSMASFSKNEISQRVLSAKRLKMNELRNEIQSLQMRMKDMEDENRMLKRVQKRQEKDLMKYDSKKGELPDIYKSHTLEVHSLQNQLRQAKTKNIELERNLNSRDRQLVRQQEELKKLQKMVDELGLQEKKDLMLKNTSLEDEIKQKDTNIQSLKQQKEMAIKSNKRELAAKMAQQKELLKNIAELKIQNEKQVILLKEKDRELLKWAMQAPQRKFSSRTPFLEAIPISSRASTSNLTSVRGTNGYGDEISLPHLQSASQFQPVKHQGEMPTETSRGWNALKSGIKHIDLSTNALLGESKDQSGANTARYDGSNPSSQATSPKNKKQEVQDSLDSSPPKKESFLEKLQAIESTFASGNSEPSTPTKINASEKELQQDKKKALLDKLKAIDNSSPKHQNKLMSGGENTNVEGPTILNSRNGAKDENFVFGSYQPSFKMSPRESRNSSATTNQLLRRDSGSEKKSNLMSTLFGNSLPESGEPSAVIGNDSLESKKAGLPWT